MKTTVSVLLFFLLTLMAQAQGPVRRADTLNQVLAIDPTKVAVGKLSYLVMGRTNVTDRELLLVDYDPTNSLAADGSTIFTNVTGSGRWVIRPILASSPLTFMAGTNMQVTVSSNIVTYSMTNSAGGTLKWEGITISNPNLKDATYIYWVPSGSDLRAYIVQNSIGFDRLEPMAFGTVIGRFNPVTGTPQAITIGANLNLDTGTGVLSATGGTSATNGTTLSVDGGTPLTIGNIADSSKVNPSVTGSNITFTIVSNSLTTNDVDSTFLTLLLNQHKVNAWTLLPLVFTNNLSSDVGRIVHYTNANGHIISYATNLPSGGSGEVNTASNLGTTSSTNQPLFKTKSGVDLQFRNLAVGPNLTLTALRQVLPHWH